MRFQVPQYIEVEDKIFGPLTLKQFLFLVGGLGLAFVSFRFIGPLGLIIGVPIAIFGTLLAFFKFNNKPFIFIVEAFANYAARTKLYLWRKVTKPQSRTEAVDSSDALLYIPKLSQDKLRDMNWNLDTGDQNTASDRVTQKTNPTHGA